MSVNELTEFTDPHAGPIIGALGTVGHGDIARRHGWSARLRTLLAILGPGLIVMVGDNDAGAFGTYTQAGQDYGTALLWTLPLLIPVLYLNQEMVLRLGAVTRMGHARLIFNRFGRFWGAFSVIDLFLLNALTIVTEFIGITLAFQCLDLPRTVGVVGAAILVMAASSTGSFRRFEQFALLLVLGSVLLVPVFVMVHPPLGGMARDFIVPRWPGGRLAEVMELVIAIVGTTIAPWQLFFQQSYVVDKRITPRFIRYERIDLLIGIALVVAGAAAMMGLAAAAFAGRPEFGHFTDAAGVGAGLAVIAGRGAEVMFALALIDASIIGAASVSLATAYALGDVLAFQHSLHRKPSEAKGFYAIYFGLIALSAALVLTPGTPLGLLTNAVQTLAGVLLPSATVFLLLLCNDREVLGPWVNTPMQNLLTGAVIAALVMLSAILTAAMLFPDISAATIIIALAAGGLAAVVAALVAWRGGRGGHAAETWDDAARATWRMKPLARLAPAHLGAGARLWLGVLRLYLVVAAGLVLARILTLALGGA